MAPDWFEALTGFRERTYEETQRQLEVADGRLRSRVNGRSYAAAHAQPVELSDQKQGRSANERQRVSRANGAGLRGPRE